MLRHTKGLIGLSFALVVVVLISESLALAQTGTTSLRGAVTDKSGATVAGAKVNAINAAQAINREGTTGSAGEYEFLGLQPGVYSLTVEKDGFRKYEQNKLQLLVNSPATQNVTLEIGSSVQTVEVSAQTQTLNTSDASLGTAFTVIKTLTLETAPSMEPEAIRVTFRWMALMLTLIPKAMRLLLSCQLLRTRCRNFALPLQIMGPTKVDLPALK